MMRRRHFLAAIAAMPTIGVRAWAAELGPEYVGVFVAVDPKTGVQSELERQTPQAQTKLRLQGFGGGRTYMEVPGPNSPVRFASGKPIAFLVRVSTQERDPQSFVQLWSLASSKGSRQLPMASVKSLLDTSGKIEVQSHKISFTAVKFGRNFFKIVPVTPLLPGEYWISQNDIHEAFCFGVD